MPDPFSVLHGDLMELLPGIPDATFHSCVTDPPYHLGSIVRRFGPTGSKAPKGGDGQFQRQARGFLGQTWDAGDVAFRASTWAEVRRAVKPGGFLLAFAHETNDDLVKGAIRSSGWEIWGTIPWIYATGSVMGNLALPGGMGTRLKRSHEPIVVARNPLTERTVQAQVDATGTGALRIDDCRVDGRWPMNVLFSHDPACGPHLCAPGCPVEELLRQGAPDAFPTFRYCPKPGPAEKQAGLDLLPEVLRRRVNPGGMERDPKWAPIPTRNPHATVKPISLMRWLVRLVTPEGGSVFDPFAGSGTTGVAAILEGLHPTMIEMLPREPDDDDYIAVILSRCLHAVETAEGQELVEIEGDLGPHHSELSMLANVRRQGALHGLEEAELVAWGESLGMIAAGTLQDIPEGILEEMSERMAELDTPELLQEVRRG